jgi:hypothetical protein
MRKIAFTGTVISIFAFMVAGGCGPAQSKKSLSSVLDRKQPTTQTPDEPPPGPVVVPTGSTFALSSPSKQTLHLDDARTVQVALTSSTYSGPVSLTVDTSGFTVPGAADVRFSVAPASVTLAAGQTVLLTVTIESLVSAPSFTGQSVQIVATAPGGGASSVARAQLPLDVLAVYEVKLAGGAAPESWDSPTAPVSLRRHPGGVLVRFTNMDTASNHIIHSAGVVPHQNTNSPMAPAPAPNSPGGRYEVNVTSQNATSSTYYCHTHEAAGNGRRINFNAVP